MSMDYTNGYSAGRDSTRWKDKRIAELEARERELAAALQKIVDATPANEWDVWPHHHFYLVTAREALAKHKGEQ